MARDDGEFCLRAMFGSVHPRSGHAHYFKLKVAWCRHRRRIASQNRGSSVLLGVPIVVLDRIIPDRRELWESKQAKSRVAAFSIVTVQLCVARSMLLLFRVI